MIYNDGTFEENGEVWFVGYLDNVLYHINSIGKLEIVAIIPTEGTDTYRMNPICIKNKNEIICLPDRAKKIMIYDILTRRFKDISISLDANRYTISNAWIEEKILWCISYRTGELIRCNLENQEIRKILVCSPNYKSGSGEAIKVNQYLYVLHKDRCAVTEFNTKTEKRHTFELDCKDKGFGTIVNANNNFYLTGFEKNIYKWDKKNNCVTTIEIDKKIKFYMEKNNSNSSRFFQSRYVNGYILIIPQNNAEYVCDDVVLYDLQEEIVKIYSLREEKMDRMFGEYLVYNCLLGESILIQDYSQKDYWKLNIKTGEIGKHKLNINYEANDRFLKENGLKDFSRESDCFRLKDFIMHI